MVSRDAPSFGTDYKLGRMTVLNDLEYALWNNAVRNSSAHLSEDELETAYEQRNESAFRRSRGATSFRMHEMITGTGHKTAEISSMFLILCTFFAMHQLNFNSRNM